ncbi:MAG: M23 family metallopeptidase [Bifidobacteriaceae bacterium]|jgi:murein DD-endopeptidase MepM/ murein hydrolase activator NlpD|nr:M23 family metallopeptidase [Bifidobacteriaceae bacterium]
MIGTPRLAAVTLALAGTLLATQPSATLNDAGFAPALAPAASLVATEPEAGTFGWPLVEPVVVVRPFDLPVQPWLAGHRGVDLLAAAGSAVLAPAAGSVSFNGWIVDRHVLVIRHGELASTLEPVLSDLAVGDLVRRGESVGTLAGGEAWHCPDCLHWGVRRGEQYLDPTLLVEPRPRAVLWR